MLFVQKRNGNKETIQFDKITERITKLINPPELLNTTDESAYLDPTLVAMKVVASLYPGITTEELDIVSSEICVNLSTNHPSYAFLGGRILISNLHKKTFNNFSDKIELLANNTDIINNEFLSYVQANKDVLNKIINYDRDYIFDYFGYKTLERSYLLKIKDNIIERPQDMYMRTAITLQMGNIDKIKTTYDMMSLSYYTHASPTLFNSGTKHMQLSSCFLENTEVMTLNDNIKKIQDITIGDMVITHMGRAKKVLQLHKNKLNSRKVMELKVSGTKPIYVTDNHRFLTIHPDMNNINGEWVCVKDMTPDHSIAIPSYEGNKNIINFDLVGFNQLIFKDDYEKQYYKRNLIIDNDMAKVLGMYIVYGSHQDDSITFTVSNLEDRNFIFNVMNSKFRLDFSIKDNNNSILLTFYSKYISDLFIFLIDSMTEWNKSLIISFIEGLNSKLNTEYTIIVSERANYFYHLFRMYGIIVSIDNNILRISLKHTETKKFLSVLEVNETNLTPEYVYTLGIEDDHSYNVEGLVCENCFLLGLNDDLTSISHTWDSCAQISKWAGGIGLHVSNIRGKNSIINGTGGKSNGIVPFLRVFNDIARWIDQGGRRPGSIAIYIEPHHPDIFDFLDLKKNFGSETERARDLFLSLWVSDLFMKQVEADNDWYLLSSDECPNLDNVYGDEFEKLYWYYVNAGKYRTVVKARKLWMAILDSQIETGLPYIGYKDSINNKCNQKNLGTIKSSNLCHEITEYSDDKEYAVCNLASIALKTFIIPFKYNSDDKWTIYTKPNCNYCKYAKAQLNNNNCITIEKEFNAINLMELKSLLNIGENILTFPQIFHNNKIVGGWSDLYHYTAGTFDYDKLYGVAYNTTVNLNQVIDINYYPVPETKLSNMKHRPIGLGIQGLADALVMMKIPYDSDMAIKLNAKIMETIYLASLTASNDMAKERYEDMKYFIENIDHIMNTLPEFYDSKYVIDITDLENDDNILDRMNKIYHKLKPNKYELSRPISTTLGSYSSFDGSPFSKGIFQFDMWPDVKLVYKERWDKLRVSVIKYGTRNSLLTALMPTASTSQILGNNECFEFFTNNIYTRKTLAGDFVLVNKYLVNDLININIWSNDIKNRIIADDGSIQNINMIPDEIKNIYKTIWEIKQVWVLKGALARGPFVDQTQSMNIFMASPDYQRLSSSHFWGWKNGLKTGMYYLRTKPSTGAIKFTIDPNMEKKILDCESCSA
jgi:ribonucleoside-diphosphate reductase alpha subunit